MSPSAGTRTLASPSEDSRSVFEIQIEEIKSEADALGQKLRVRTVDSEDIGPTSGLCSMDLKKIENRVRRLNWRV